MVSDDKILSILSGGNNINDILNTLIETANSMGGTDNISAVIIDMR